MLYVIGIGPGNEEFFTKEAENILNSVDMIVCYKGYKEYIERFQKEIYVNGMTKEVERVEYALNQAKNKTVALVSNGDATIYGLASLAFELNEKNFEKVEINVVSGITSASICSAILGAPLNHDFSVVSLSDLLTPLEKILKRIICAFESDMILAIYNPLGKKRKEPFLSALEIILDYSKDRNIDYVIGIVKNAGRDKQEYKITTINGILENLDYYMDYIDMSTTLIVGNSNTKIINGKMITPRGYLSKY
ncbi:precorrin-3B C17-methyltransferase [Methanococcus vannielii SB]|uniref:Precorrin-3B C17-methyltransferase n=1 Tax=Methanococcus vannielii (strain ATCC 35089 / DSM 1224 / JCM 13029 / OCM 148 / SB) TaxID=406327 RepID=A6UNS3_METVS|nr:precorrin-3B C(17)-methyltransferase [Methanococcus vannielii]ABR54145.1 precorrin-3B C17-methyltransferase [Methanococcus vannielii SB]